MFWTTGCALFKYGQNKEKAAEYIKALTYDSRSGRTSIVGTKSGHPGQLPPYKSIYADWDANKPDWMPPFVGLVRGQLDRAKAINNNLFGLQQFVIGKPIWETYLKGEEPDPKVAMQKVVDGGPSRDEEGRESSESEAEGQGARNGRAGPCLRSDDAGRDRRLRAAPRTRPFQSGGRWQSDRWLAHGADD